MSSTAHRNKTTSSEMAGPDSSEIIRRCAEEAEEGMDEGNAYSFQVGLRPQAAHIQNASLSQIPAEIEKRVNLFDVDDLGGMDRE